LVALLGSACSGEDVQPSSSTASATTTVALDESASGALAYQAYSDPSTPIVVALGRRFALQFETQPGQGARWTLANEPDPAIVVPLGTNVRTPTPPDTGSTTQLMNFAANGIGTTTITVHYVAASGEVLSDPGPQTFTVVVTFTGEPPPPPPEPSTTLPNQRRGR
jgi:hypothetical protein